MTDKPDFSIKEEPKAQPQPAKGAPAPKRRRLKVNAALDSETNSVVWR